MVDTLISRLWRSLKEAECIKQLHRMNYININKYNIHAKLHNNRQGITKWKHLPHHTYQGPRTLPLSAMLEETRPGLVLPWRETFSKVHHQGTLVPQWCLPWERGRLLAGSSVSSMRKDGGDLSTATVCRGFVSWWLVDRSIL